MIFTESWLDYTTPDAAIELDGFAAHRADRTVGKGEKMEVGCVSELTTLGPTIEKQCCLKVEFMLLKCRPFYLPREFSAVYICAVYIPPDPNAKMTLIQLNDSINNSLVAHHDCVFIAAEDFDHANLKMVVHNSTIM